VNNINNPPGKRILYVEGYEDNRSLMEFLLQHLGYDCQAVTTRSEGWFLATRERFDLYMLDTWYSDGTGIGLCRQIREMDPITPIIFFSAWTPRATQAEAIAAGANAYLLKPGIDEVLLEIKRRLMTTNACAEYPMITSVKPVYPCTSPI
jgi:CheY-like chemotaxis protein